PRSLRAVDLDDADACDHAIRYVVDRERRPVIVHVQALAHDHEVPGCGRSLVETLLGVAERERGEGCFEPAPGVAERGRPLALQLLLDRADGILAHPRGMTRRGTIGSRESRWATAAGSAGTASPEASSSTNPASRII